MLFGYTFYQICSFDTDLKSTITIIMTTVYQKQFQTFKADHPLTILGKQLPNLWWWSKITDNCRYLMKKFEFAVTKGVNTIRKSKKDGQHNDQQKEDNDLQIQHRKLKSEQHETY
jgi:hypothetical protein